jgi:hypothetical protein
MTDRILAERLATLSAALKEVEAAGAWPKRFDRLKLNTDIWNPVAVEIRDRARELCGDVSDVQEVIANTAERDQIVGAWQEYVRISQESEELFKERLDILGGLAFRNNELDDKICQLADELIHSTVKSTRIAPSLTVPGAVQARTKTLARVIRLRFPEWTIWTLPFTAHEYGRVVADQFETLGALLGSSPSTNGDPQLAADVLIADAFATFAVGPAFALAAIRTRFNPAATPAPGYPPDGQRAAVIFGVLETMNKEERGRVSLRSPGPYAQIAQELGNDWAALSDRLGVQWPPKETEEFVGRLCAAVLADNALEAVRYPYQRDADWPDDGLFGWKIAQEWSEKWLADLGATRPLSRPPISTGSSVRDAVNAAWHSRLVVSLEENDPETARLQIEALGRATVELCERIGAHEVPSASGVGGIPAPQQEPSPGGSGFDESKSADAETRRTQQST